MPSITVGGLSDVYSRLDKLDARTNSQDLLDTSGAFMLHRIRERFLKQESPDGSTWPESNAAKQRKKTGRDGGTLFDSGNLFHSISLGRSGVNGRSIFTTIDYAEKHNNGLGGQERREFLGFNEEDERGVVNIIEDRVRSALR